MNLEQWLACASEEYLSGEFLGLSDRLLRLFACACLRRVWALLPASSCRDAVEACEQFTDGLLRADQLYEAWIKSELETEEGLWRERCWWDDDDAPRWPADEDDQLLRGVQATLRQSSRMAARAALYAADLVAWGEGEEGRQAERLAQHRLYCDVLGQPRLTRLDASWLRWHDGTVAKMARAIHSERCFADLPILADALEEAGCTDGAILEHCRSEPIHARGCWVVELLLGNG